MFDLRVDEAVALLKPSLALFHAVLRVNAKLPGWELSVKPSAEFPNAMLLVTTWFA